MRGRRRRRGGDRPARHELALEQVPQPGDGRRRPADPPPQRLQDRQPHGARPDPARGADGADGGLRPHALLRRGRRSRRRPPAARRDPRPGARRHPRDPAAGPRGRRHGAPALADDRVPDAEGLDGPEGDRRAPGRGHLAEPPGADERGPRQRGQPRDPRALDALVPTRGAVRRRGPAAPRAGRAAADRHAPDERQPRRQRRRAPARAAAAGLPGLRRGRPVARRDDRGGDAGARHVRPRRDGPQHRQLPDVRAGRDRVQPPRLRARGDRPHLDGRDRPGRRPPRARTAASWRCSRSTSARAGSRATC